MAFPFTPQQQPAQQLFTPQQPSPFQQPTPFFQSQQQQQQPFQQQQQQQQLQLQTFQQQQQQQQQQLHLQQFQQQQQQQLYLFTNEKAPATYSTKWADLHPDSQKHLLQIEERILEYRDESQRLEQCSRLYDSSVSSDGFESDASLTVQELGGISTAMERQKAVTEELMSVVKDMLRNTEVAVRSFLMLRPRFLHLKSGLAPNNAAIVQASGAIGTGQPMTAAAAPVFDFYNGIPRKPSPFLHQTVARFDKNLGECLQLIEELEQLLLVDSDRNGLNSGSSLLQALPKTMSNVHDFFVHVVARVESIHQYIGSMRTAYIANQRRMGIYNDPFLEADRREAAKEEAAARRVHPTLHLPISQQPTTQVSGLTTSAVPTAPQTTTAIPAASSSSGASLFATPSAGISSSSLFSTPATAAPAPTSSSSLFGGSAAPAQTSLFGTSTPAPTSLFGTSTPALGSTSLFASTPSVAVPSFSTPFPSAGVAGSGASFGTASKPRAKARTGRR